MADGVPTQAGRADVFLRDMPPYFICPEDHLQLSWCPLYGTIFTHLLNILMTTSRVKDNGLAAYVHGTARLWYVYASVVSPVYTINIFANSLGKIFIRPVLPKMLIL